MAASSQTRITRSSAAGVPNEVRFVDGDEETRTNLAQSLRSRNSCFIATWRGKNKHSMRIPDVMAMERAIETRTNIDLDDPQGWRWPIVLSADPDTHIADMKEGWSDVGKFNKLESGDTLIFELVTHNSRMQLHVLRAARPPVPTRNPTIICADNFKEILTPEEYHCFKKNPAFHYL